MDRNLSGKFDANQILNELSEPVYDIELMTDSFGSATLDDIDESPDSENKPIFVSKKLKTDEIAKIVLNLENSHESYNVIHEIPDSPPNVTGTHTCFLSTLTITDIRQPRGDGMGSWNNSKQKYNIDQIGVFLKDGKYSAVTRDTQGAQHIVSVCRLKHPEFDVTKNVYWAKSNDHVPVAGTFFVIVYNVKKPFQLPNIVKKILNKGTAAQIKNIIVGKTATEARNAYCANGGLISNNDFVTIKQIQNLQHRSESWNPVTKKGRPKNEDPEAIRRILENGYFLRAHYQSDNFQEDRYFFTTNTHLHLFKRCLLKKKLCQKIKDLTEKLMQYPPNERYQKAKEIVEEKDYQEWMLAGICYIDVTFNVGGGYVLTLLICSCQHIRNPKGKPFSFVVAGMLSRGHTTKDLKWFGTEFALKIDLKNLCVFSLISDAERTIDGFIVSTVFQEPAGRLNCDIHGAENINHMCDKDIEIIKDLFGSNAGHIHRKGLLDELDYEQFYNKITAIATSDRWQQYPKLLNLVGSESRLKYFYDRHNLKNRIACGFGFNMATTNRSENSHALIKEKKLHDNLPLQDVIKNIQDFMIEEILNITHIYYDNSKCKFYDENLFMGPVKWKQLSEEEMRAKWFEIGLIHTDLLPGLESVLCILPRELSAKLSEEQRKLFIKEARTYIVYHSEVEPDYYMVTKGHDSRKINITETPIICDCNIARKKESCICPHLLAVSIQYPSTNIMKKMVDYLASETVPQRNKRLLTPAHGCKFVSELRQEEMLVFVVFVH